jgi:hypothetical protein
MNSFGQELPVIFLEKKFNTFRYFDGKIFHNIESWQQLPENCHRLNLKNVRSMCVPLQKTRSEPLTLKEMYDYIISQYNLMKTILPDMNPYKHKRINHLIEQCAIDYSQLRYFGAELVRYDEYQWLDGATMGGYHGVYQKGTFTNVKGYDQKNSYNSVIMLPNFQVPIKNGKLTTILDINFQKGFINRGSFSYGIYRCQVEGYHNFFKLNSKGYYTHFGLKIIYLINQYFNHPIKIHLIEDGQPNCLLYPAKLGCIVYGSAILGSFIQRMDRVRKEHPECPIIKSFSSSLYGYLSRKIKLTITCDKIPKSLPEGFKIESISPVDEETFQIKLIDPIKVYSTPLARIKAFILDKQRLTLLENVLIPFHNLIISTHTDGFIAKQNIPKFDQNPKIMGNFCPDHDKDYSKLMIDDHFKIIEKIK